MKELDEPSQDLMLKRGRGRKNVNECKSRKYFCDMRVKEYKKVESQEIFHAKMKRKKFRTQSQEKLPCQR